MAGKNRIRKKCSQLPTPCAEIFQAPIPEKIMKKIIKILNLKEILEKFLGNHIEGHNTKCH